MVGNSRKKSKAQIDREIRAAFHERPPLPIVLLCVDPGSISGSSIFVEGVLEECRQVDIYTREVESVVRYAIEKAAQNDMPLVLGLESWGTGGQRGINQWIGLGMAKGAWTRAYRIAIASRTERSLFTKRIATYHQATWRSHVFEEFGKVSPKTGKWRPFNSDEWKQCSVDFFRQKYGTNPPGPDAAESVCMGYYAVRSDETSKTLPKKLQEKWTSGLSPLDSRRGNSKN